MGGSVGKGCAWVGNKPRSRTVASGGVPRSSRDGGEGKGCLDFGTRGTKEKEVGNRKMTEQGLLVGLV